MTDDPDNAGECKREKQAEKRTGKSDDDFVERRYPRERGAIDIGFALDDVHRRELRQRDESTEGN